VLKAFLGDINVRAIIEFCPKLQSLKLNENNRYSTTVSFKEDAKPYHSKRSRIERKPLVLKNLEKLLVVRPYYVENAEAQVEEQISSEDLLCLISSPSLIDIEIRDCPNLTDCVFESASEIHQFLSLEKLTLFKCNSLTRKGIDVVMNNQTPLKTIDVRSCGNITDGDIALLISNARSEKWQLSVEYVNENGKRIKM
jgi:Holliday junction resolvase-like predicted endonuclease